MNYDFIVCHMHEEGSDKKQVEEKEEDDCGVRMLYSIQVRSTIVALFDRGGGLERQQQCPQRRWKMVGKGLKKSQVVTQ